MKKYSAGMEKKCFTKYEIQWSRIYSHRYHLVHNVKYLSTEKLSKMFVLSALHHIKYKQKRVAMFFNPISTV